MTLHGKSYCSGISLVLPGLEVANEHLHMTGAERTPGFKFHFCKSPEMIPQYLSAFSSVIQAPLHGAATLLPLMTSPP